jgi:hypothetical protein
VRVHERAVHLERENDLLRAELAVLRANPHTNSSSEAQSQVQELTLSLRRLSHKLSLTEEFLFAKTNELIHAHAESVTAKANADNAYELGARVRGREEAGKVRERDLERKVVQLEEDLKMADVVMKEYAALVRGMEAKSSESGHSNGDIPQTLAATFSESELSRERFLLQFRTDSEKLHLQLEDVTAKLEKATAQLAAATSSNQAIRAELGRTRTELEKLQLEDGTAAKMVSRYMYVRVLFSLGLTQIQVYLCRQFSQASTNKLLSTLSTLKARQEGTLSTLSSQNFALSTQLRSSEVQNERLRSALDELGGEILKESYGRRREVALRIKMGGREDRIVEGLRRWVRRGDEALTRLRGASTAESNALFGMAQDARILLESLEEGALDEGTALSLSGSRARAFLIDNGLDGLLDELREENERRVMLEKKIASIRLDEAPVNGTSAPRKDEQELRTDGHHADDKPPKVPEKSYSPILHLPTTTITPVIRQGPLKVDRAVDGPADNLSSQMQDEEPSGSSLSTVVPEVKTQVLPPTTTPPVIHQSQLKVNGALDGPTDSLLSQVQDGEQLDSSLSPVVPKAETLDNVEIRDQSIPSSELAAPDSPPHLGSELASSPKIDSDAIPTDSENVDNPQHLTPPATVDTITLVSETKDVAHEITAVEDTLDDPPPPTVLETTVRPPPSEDPPSQPQHPISFPSAPIIITPERTPSPHPLLADLARVSKRYDDLQRAFRDCHIALEGLKVSLTSDTSPTTPIPVDILEAALGRLNDYTEDARVELEIRVGDEALLAKGYEALLCVPGAMAASTSVREDESKTADEPTRLEVETQIQEFVSGNDRAVRKARETFTRKLEDVQHDIASLKRAIYDPDSLLPPSSAMSSSSSSHFQNLSPSASTSTLNLATPSKSDTANGGGSWTSWIRGSPSRPSSPAHPGMGPAPTFGNIMTSPRLRPSPSTGSFQNHTQTPTQTQGSRRSSFFNLSGTPTDPQPKDPLAQLGLKIPMPNFGMSTHGGLSAGAGPFGGYGPYGILSPTSPLGMSAAPATTTTTRARTVSSSMYMLGLGAVGSSGRISRSTSSSGVSVSSISVSANGVGIGSPLGMSRQVSLQSQASDYSNEGLKNSEGVERESGGGGGGEEEEGGGDGEMDAKDDADTDTDVE